MAFFIRSRARQVLRLLLAQVWSCAVCFLLIGCGKSEHTSRRPLPGDRIVAESASATKWNAGQINDLLIRYRFAESERPSALLDAALFPPDTLPRARIEYFRGSELIAAEDPPAWCKRFC